MAQKSLILSLSKFPSLIPPPQPPAQGVLYHTHTHTHTHYSPFSNPNPDFDCCMQSDVTILLFSRALRLQKSMSILLIWYAQCSLESSKTPRTFIAGLVFIVMLLMVISLIWWTLLKYNCLLFNFYETHFPVFNTVESVRLPFDCYE